MNRRLIHLAVCSLCTLHAAIAAEPMAVTLTLEQAIARARACSVDAAAAANELRQAYWEYRSYRAELLPEVNFSATAPGFYKQYTAYMNAQGEYNYVRNNYLQAAGEISLDQNIWLTGGKLSLNTRLDFLRQFSDTPYNRYMSVPVALTLRQAVFGVNEIKWQRRIEPLRYTRAKAAYLSATEDVAMQAISLFFTLLLCDEEMAVATQNLDNAVKLHEVAREKRQMGHISRNDLLQMELNELQARATLTDALSQRKSAAFALATFLGYDADTEVAGILPGQVPDTEITYADALSRANDNNSFAHTIRLRQLDAEYAVAKAKANLRSIDVFAQIGYTGTDRHARSAYGHLRSNQVVEVGVKLPLIDWGRRRGRVKVAESNRRVVQDRLQREQQAFDQDIFVLVQRFANQRRQVEIARRADEIAQCRYQTNVETYIIGRLSTLDLNDSQLKKDQSRRDYVSRLYDYWQYYYQLRSLTLWDYERQCPVDADFDHIIRQ